MDKRKQMMMERMAKRRSAASRPSKVNYRKQQIKEMDDKIAILVKLLAAPEKHSDINLVLDETKRFFNENLGLFPKGDMQRYLVKFNEAEKFVVQNQTIGISQSTITLKISQNKESHTSTDLNYVD